MITEDLSMTDLSTWQDSEYGFPTDAYFEAVITALEIAGITIGGCWRDEPWDYTIRLDADTLPDTDVYVGWSVDEHCNPLSETGLTGHGWLVLTVDAENTSKQSVRDLNIDGLADPAQVAAAAVVTIWGEASC